MCKSFHQNQQTVLAKSDICMARQLQAKRKKKGRKKKKKKINLKEASHWTTYHQQIKKFGEQV